MDWGMPCQGALWQDLMGTHPLTRDAAESGIDVVLVAGYAAYRLLAQRPVDPSVPERNAFHIACAEASLRWLRRRAAVRTDL